MLIIGSAEEDREKTKRSERMCEESTFVAAQNKNKTRRSYKIKTENPWPSFVGILFGVPEILNYLYIHETTV